MGRNPKILLLAALIASAVLLGLWKGHSPGEYEFGADGSAGAQPGAAATPPPPTDASASPAPALPRTPIPGSRTTAVFTAHRAGAAPAQRTASQWAREFRDRRDVVKLILEAAKAAEGGDDAAAHELFEVTLRCSLYIRQARSGMTTEQFRARIDASDPFFTPRTLAEFEYCAPIGRAPELADWENPRGKLSPTYWRQEAERLGNPTLVTVRIAGNVADLPRLSGEARVARAAQVAADMRSVLRSGDGEGWYQLGMLINDNSASSDPAAGLALALASCDLGYDCTKNNRRNTWGSCPIPGCVVAKDLEEHIRDNYPSSTTGRAYEKLLELKELIRRQDWEGIEQFVRPDGPSMQPGWRWPNDGAFDTP